MLLNQKKKILYTISKSLGVVTPQDFEYLVTFTSNISKQPLKHFVRYQPEHLSYTYSWNLQGKTFLELGR